MLKHVTQVVLRAAMPLLCCEPVKPQRMVHVAGRALTVLQHARKVVLCIAVALGGSEVVQANGFDKVHRHTLAVLVPAADRVSM